MPAQAQQNLKQVPGMFGPPVVGDTLIFLFQKKRYQAMQSKNRKDCKMWKFDALGFSEVFIHDPDTVQLVGEMEHEFVSAVRKEAMAYNMGTPYHILNMERPLHGTVRQAYFQTMTKAALAQYIPAIHTAISSIMAPKARKGEFVKPWFAEGVSLGITTLRGSYQPEAAQQVQAKLSTMVTVMGTGRKPQLREVRQLSAAVVDLLKPVVEPVMQEYYADRDARKGQQQPKPAPHPALLYNVAVACEQLGVQWDTHEWCQFALGQVFGNIATLPTIIPHLFSAFGRFPGAATKVREEQERVAGEHGGELTWEALGKLEYGERFVREVVRLGSTPGLVPRVALQDLNIDGYFVPKGTHLYLRPTLDRFKYAEWEGTAHLFDPDRWLNTATPANYKPFGAAPRSCPARALGMMQLRILLWELARNYDVDGAAVGKSFEDVPVSQEEIKLVLRAC